MKANTTQSTRARRAKTFGAAALIAALALILGAVSSIAQPAWKSFIDQNKGGTSARRGARALPPELDPVGKPQANIAIQAHSIEEWQAEPENQAAQRAEAPGFEAQAEVKPDEFRSIDEIVSEMEPDPSASMRSTARVRDRRSGRSVGSFFDGQGQVGQPMSGSGAGSGKAKFNLGAEADEQGARSDLFLDPDVLRMLGEEPRFVYDATNLPDPMVFPPVRNQAIFNELWSQAETLAKEGDLEGAVAVLQRIMAMADDRFIIQVNSRIGEINTDLAEALAAAAAAARVGQEVIVVAELPDWIRDNTSGVLFDADKPMCLVGDYLLGVGDDVPSHPGVSIAMIGEEMVTYEVSQQAFEVEVKGYYVP